jgi:RNA-directed DNA polymerase
MATAWKRVKANAGSAGADGLTVSQSAEYLKTDWLRIREELQSGRYRPQPVRRRNRTAYENCQAHCIIKK